MEDAEGVTMPSECFRSHVEQGLTMQLPIDREFRHLTNEIDKHGIAKTFSELTQPVQGYFICRSLEQLGHMAAWKRDHAMTPSEEYMKAPVSQRETATYFRHLRSCAPYAKELIPDEFPSRLAGKHFVWIEAPYNQNDPPLNPNMRRGEQLSKAQGGNACATFFFDSVEPHNREFTVRRNAAYFGW